MEIRELPPERVEELRPLWLELLAHHGSVAPQRGPTLAEDESWQLRRALYDEWLRAPGSFVLVSGPEGAPTGYVLVEVHERDDTWRMGERLAEVQTLVVSERARNTGVGAALLDAAEAALRERGVGGMFVGVVSSNDDALRFYRRRGLEPHIVQLYKPI
jgi:ribosomal protein S18 acetylase RimI-like enzyme